MDSGLLQTLGGVGLFLLGMSILTSALRALADERLREILARAVKTPLQGVITGTISTAILQSSSATTVAAVGFVGAGVFTFSESLGVIFGANVGTTLKGWLVALLGFKMNLGQSLFPVIFVGALLRMTGRRRLESVGMCLCGFSLIFLGITFLQQGLSGFEGRITPETFPSDTVPGRLLLAALGFVITAITQSSSAGVTAAMAAVHGGTISLNQAAAMVIGMDVGTTVTAVLVTIGSNVQARRTGFAHLIYNAMTSIGAFLLLTPYMITVEKLLPGVSLTNPELVLIGFHTFFNSLGVVAVLPFTNQFARLLIRLVPEHDNSLTRHLNRSMLADPIPAISSVNLTIRESAAVLLAELRRRLHAPPHHIDLSSLQDVVDAVRQCRDYLQEVIKRFRGKIHVHDYVASMHVLDHLSRIENRVRDDKRLRRCREDEALAAMTELLLTSADVLMDALPAISTTPVEQMRAANHRLKIAMRDYRAQTLEAAASGSLSSSEALKRMDTARTLRRIGYHLWRIAFHSTSPEAGTKTVASVTPGTDSAENRIEPDCERGQTP